MIYQFNNSALNTRDFTLLVNGQQKSVEPKVFDVIVYLIRHRTRVVTRQQFFDDLWEGRLVSDATLSNHIKLARAVLEDNGEQQAVIKTVRGRGYQFIAKVKETPSNREALSTNPKTMAVATNTASASGLDSQKWLPKRTIGLFVAVCAAIITFWILFNPSALIVDADIKVEARPYILVVPFTVSADDADKWKPFADQMTREVIRKLRKISGLQVIPAASAFTFKDNKTPAYIHQLLPKVRYVLDAVVSISEQGNIRITPELDDLLTGSLIWDDDYRIQINDTNFFSVQSDIAVSVSESLKIVIHDTEQLALGQIPTKNLAAYEIYMQGQHQFEILTYDSLYRAIELFSEAIALDSGFEAAYVAKADSYRMLMSYFEKPIDILPQVTAAVIEALEINPDSAEALSSLGLAYTLAWRWDDAWKVLNKARELNPNLALTELGFALYYSGLGDVDGVHRALSRASTLDPLNVEIADWGHWALAMVGETQDAIEWGKKQIRLHPKVGMIYSGASVSAAVAGDYGRAIELATKGIELESGSSFALLALAQSYGYAGEIDNVQPLLEQAEKHPGYTCPYESAIVYLLLDKTDRAFELLNDAVDYRSNCLVFVLNDPRLAAYRNDLRFTSILTRVGLDRESVHKYSR